MHKFNRRISTGATEVSGDNQWKKWYNLCIVFPTRVVSTYDVRRS